jgi:hypothetical protein
LDGRVMDELLALAADDQCAEERLVVFDELWSSLSWFANNETLGMSQCIPGTLMSRRCCCLKLWEYRGSNRCVSYGSQCTTYFMYTLEKVESNHVMFQSVCLDWFCRQQSKLCLICVLKSKLDKIII